MSRSAFCDLKHRLAVLASRCFRSGGKSVREPTLRDAIQRVADFSSTDRRSIYRRRQTGKATDYELQHAEAALSRRRVRGPREPSSRPPFERIGEPQTRLLYEREGARREVNLRRPCPLRRSTADSSMGPPHRRSARPTDEQLWRRRARHEFPRSRDTAKPWPARMLPPGRLP